LVAQLLLLPWCRYWEGFLKLSDVETQVSPRWQRRPKDRRSEILDSAVLAFGQNGYKRTTLADVAARARVSAGTVSHYFGSKAQLFEEVVAERLMPSIEIEEASLAQHRGPAWELLEQLLRRFWERAWQPGTLDLLQVVKVESAEFPESGRMLCRQLGDRWRKLYGTILAAGIKSGEFRRMDVNVTARTMSYAVLGVADKVSTFGSYDATMPEREVMWQAVREMVSRFVLARSRRQPRRSAVTETKRARAGALAMVAAVALLGTGCKKNAAPAAPPPPEVAVVQVQPQRLSTSFEFTGEVEPYRRVEVRARVDGVVEARPFTEGSVVQPGQVLYRLDRVTSEAQYQSALARAENAKRTLDRLQPLVKDNAVAQQDVDNAGAEARAAQAELDEARKNRNDAVVRAGIEGRVGRTNFEVGARVTGSDDLLTTIDVLDPIYVSFRPSAQQLITWKQDPEAKKLIQPGSPLAVQVTLPDGTTLPRTGKLDFVAPSLDASTGTQEFRALFKNPDYLLVPGQFVRVRLNGFTRDSALAIPQRAVQQALGRQFVLVVGKGDTIVSRDVQPGLWSGNRWIIDQGLNPGDRVVVDGVQKAAPGRPVRAVALADSAVAGPEETAAVDGSAGTAGGAGATAGATSAAPSRAPAGASAQPAEGTNK
jgi:membrane fusion protein (multidrug efflux system)